MSLEINLESFPNLMAVFEEIERKEQPRLFAAVNPEVAKPYWQQKMEGKPRLFTAVDPEVENIEKQERKPMIDPEACEMSKPQRKPRCSTVMEPGQAKCYKPKCRASDPAGSHMLNEAQPPARIHNAPPCPVIDREKLLCDTRLTEAAKKLSDDELALLYQDILKPLDFYAMLHERRKQL